MAQVKEDEVISLVQKIVICQAFQKLAAAAFILQLFRNWLWRYAALLGLASLVNQGTVLSSRLFSRYHLSQLQIGAFQILRQVKN